MKSVIRKRCFFFTFFYSFYTSYSVLATPIQQPSGHVVREEARGVLHRTKNGSLVLKSRISLEDALIQTYYYNPILHSSRSHLKSVEENARIARAGFFPKVTLNGSAARTRISGNQARLGPLNIEVYSNYTLFTTPRSLELKAQQSVYDGGRTRGSLDRAHAQIAEANATLIAKEQEVLLEALNAYMQVIHNRRLLQLHTDYVHLVYQEDYETYIRSEVEEATLTDIAQTTAALAEALAIKNRTDTSLAASIATYRQVIGTSPVELIPPKDITHRLPKTLKEALQKNFKHPEVEATQHALQAAYQQEIIARSDFAPSVTVTGSLSRRYDVQFPDDQQDVAVITGQLVIPLYDGGLTAAHTQQAREAITQARFDLQAAHDRIESLIISAWSTYETARKNLELTQEQVKANVMALEGMREEYLFGERTTLDLLNTQKNLLNAQTAALTVETDYVIAAYSLLSAMGDFSLTRMKVTPTLG